MRVNLKEESLLRTKPWSGEPIPHSTCTLNREGGAHKRFPFAPLDLLDHGHHQALARSEMVNEHAVARAYLRGKLPETEIHDASAQCLFDCGVQQAIPGLRCDHNRPYHLVH